MTKRTVTLTNSCDIKVPRGVHATISFYPRDAFQPWDPSEARTYVLQLRSEAETEEEAAQMLAAAERTIRQAFQ